MIGAVLAHQRHVIIKCDHWRPPQLTRTGVPHCCLLSRHLAPFGVPCDACPAPCRVPHRCALRRAGPQDARWAEGRDNRRARVAKRLGIESRWRGLPASRRVFAKCCRVLCRVECPQTVCAVKTVGEIVVQDAAKSLNVNATSLKSFALFRSQRGRPLAVPPAPRVPSLVRLNVLAARLSGRSRPRRLRRHKPRSLTPFLLPRCRCCTIPVLATSAHQP